MPDTATKQNFYKEIPIKIRTLCALLTLSLVTFAKQTTAQPASVSGGTVILPTVTLGSEYYTVHLALIPDADSQLFSLGLAEVNPNPIMEDASSVVDGNKINVPNLIFDNQSWFVQFIINSDDPLTFRLNAIVLNEDNPGSSGGSGGIDLNELLSSAATTQVTLRSYSDALTSLYRGYGFESMLEIIIGENCNTSDATHFRLEALSKEEIILDDGGNASFTLDDFDKVDVFYSESGRPTISGGGYCPPMGSLNWTRLREAQTRDSNNRITLLDFTNLPTPHDKYHAANAGGLIYDFGTADQLPFPLTSSTQYRTQKINDLNIQLTANDNGTNYRAGTLEAINDDKITANVNVAFTDYDGSELSLSGTIESPPGSASVNTPLMPPGPGLNGCWLNDRIDAWCFNASTGQYIEYSVNGNPGTLYVDFTYSADLSSGVISSRNTFTRLRGSCCDSEQEIVGAPTNSASFKLERNKFTLGGREYIYTDKALGI